jgi:hypothetical protein
MGLWTHNSNLLFVAVLTLIGGVIIRGDILTEEK